MNLLFPGRHHLLTRFQFDYLLRVIKIGLEHEPDVNERPLEIAEPVDNIVFAVTSANHSNTRRNPVPFYLRAMQILDFGQELGIPVFVYGIDDVGQLEDFAGYTLKKIRHESEGLLVLDPANTVVVCSSPVLKMYEKLGFRILPMELKDRQTGLLATLSPWDLVEKIALTEEGLEKENSNLYELVHEASSLVWTQYRLDQKAKLLFSDDMIGADGDLTATRDYTSYVRQMDEIALLKFQETAPYLKPGRIGDIGCAVGTWIKLAARDQRFRESDFYGIEVAQHLYRICLQRKENGEFSNPYVFFAQKNAVTGLCFEPGSMNTIHSGSLTHEIESYGGRKDLLQFIKNRFEELAPGGVWVNRDVTGPENGDKIVLLWLKEDDGKAKREVGVNEKYEEETEDWEKSFETEKDLEVYLNGLSTMARFKRFARDFRKEEGEGFSFKWKKIDGKVYASLRLRDAMEFISTKDYTSNWNSEMHESFCFWSFSDWVLALKEAGFSIDAQSHSYTNQWLVENRFKGKAELFEQKNGSRIKPVGYPATHMILIAERKI